MQNEKTRKKSNDYYFHKPIVMTTIYDYDTFKLLLTF